MNQAGRHKSFAQCCHQSTIRRTYEKDQVQVAIALAISGNFMANVIEKQIDPWNIHYPLLWYASDTFWNVLFIIELVRRLFYT
eukprot:1173081-Prorocentrum_minimum.AAC.1